MNCIFWLISYLLNKSKSLTTKLPIKMSETQGTFWTQEIFIYNSTRFPDWLSDFNSSYITLVYTNAKYHTLDYKILANVPALSITESIQHLTRLGPRQRLTKHYFHLVHARIHSSLNWIRISKGIKRRIKGSLRDHVTVVYKSWIASWANWMSAIVYKITNHGCAEDWKK